MYQKETKKEPKDTKKLPKGAKRVPKGSNNEAKGAKSEPINAKRAAKESQGAPKGRLKTAQMHQKIDLRKMIPKSGPRVEIPGYLWVYFWELKTFKSVVLSSISCFFVFFGKSEKQNNFGSKRGAILEPIFNFRGSQNPNFSRQCTCR